MGSSATKEARKKRMARQRQFLLHHRSLNHHQRQHPSPHTEQHAKLPSEGNCTNTTQTNPEN
uniref:Uncharacterized protein n=1 Tax=Nelumbo nucifera TaxID=4432 RepID=A0A822ZL91_NELNU|nr:TPA_asm: hypothetical protein HUJ06_004182 [Nelumbo nucifera]